MEEEKVEAEAEVPIDFGAKEPEPEPEPEIESKPEPEPVEAEEIVEATKEEGFGEIFSKQITTDLEPELSENNQDIPISEPAKPKSFGASLFGIEDDQIVPPKPAYVEPESSSGEEEEDETPKKVEMPQMSTGEAIFADLPSVPNIGSTGATLFGMSDESAKVNSSFN
jgi:hypothetical protein